MSKLISGKEAKLAWANGEQLEVNTGAGWEDLTPNYCLSVFDCRFPTSIRLKPRTITINGIEVPAPVQKPELGKLYYTLVGNTQSGFTQSRWTNEDFTFPFGCWETLDEIQQVLEATQKAFEVQP